MRPASSAGPIRQDALLACCACALETGQQISCGQCACNAGLCWGVRCARVPVAIIQLIQSLPSLEWGALSEPGPPF